MPFKKRSDCTTDETVAYLEHYFATRDLISNALAKYETLARESPTASVRSEFRARALEAQRDLELLTNQRRDFLSNQSGIQPPSPAQVDEAVGRGDKLAKLAAKQSQAEAIVKIATEGLTAFEKLHSA